MRALETLERSGSPSLLENLTGDDVVEAEHFGVHDVAAGEDHQLAGEPGRPLRRAADLLDVVEHAAQPRIVARQSGYLLGEQVGEAADDVEQVVEVVAMPPTSWPGSPSARRAGAGPAPRPARCRRGARHP